MTRVQYTHGSILDAKEYVIAHGCNAQGKMASGVAAAIATRWRDVRREYEMYCSHYGLGLKIMGQVAGFVLVDEGRPTEHIVANVITQERYGRNPECRYMSYDAVDEGMRRVAQYTKRHTSGRPVVGLPLIGAGLGGGRWSIIEGILEEITVDTGVLFNVYVPEGVLYRSLLNGYRHKLPDLFAAGGNPPAGAD